MQGQQSTRKCKLTTPNSSKGRKPRRRSSRASGTHLYTLVARNRNFFAEAGKDMTKHNGRSTGGCVTCTTNTFWHILCACQLWRGLVSAEGQGGTSLVWAAGVIREGTGRYS